MSAKRLVLLGEEVREGQGRERCAELRCNTLQQFDGVIATEMQVVPEARLWVHAAATADVLNEVANLL